MQAGRDFLYLKLLTYFILFAKFKYRIVSL